MKREKQWEDYRLARDKVLSKLVSLKFCLRPLNKIPFMLKVLDPSDMQDQTEATFLAQKITCCFVPDVNRCNSEPSAAASGRVHLAQVAQHRICSPKMPAPGTLNVFT